MATSPTSGPGGGSSFNGGTITTPLRVDPSDQTADALIAEADAASRADGSHVPLSVQDEFGDYLFKADQYGGFQADGRLYGAGSVVILGSGRSFLVENAAGAVKLQVKDPASLGFFGATPATKPTVTGAKLPSDVALASLLTGLAALGLITDSTT